MSIPPSSSSRFLHLTGKPVRVRASGMEYRGILVEITDAEIRLRGVRGWVSVPLEAVSHVLGEGDPEPHTGPEKFVDRRFYDDRGE